ncbi:glycoside hydrolase family 5 protein [Microdochium bolleyi]|uniref:Glycoside hydrolase family 5 protein n=1 Tax=Microdochium bolleyi TaxID=196109 RepID=A0A136IYA2_9PEZI|nr:glycoside hydrolase family 5 protein [Microdochium bolleyi]
MRQALCLTLLGLSSLAAAAPTVAAESLDARQAAWPFGPLSVSGRDIKNTKGETVVFAGTNWPGHGEVMIPEGLQYQSIATIVSKIRSIGMNAVRLTFAIQMVDEIYANNGADITVKKAFEAGLGQTNGTRVYQQFLAKNPQFNDQTTRLQVYDAVAAELARQKVYIDLDNHMSRGAWCCGLTDGNGWPGDRDFNEQNWYRGLRYMADHAKRWPAVVAMSMRNEFRSPDATPELARTKYNWQEWYRFSKIAAGEIHAGHPDVLVLLSGLNYDTYLTPLVQGTAFTPGTEVFNPARDFPGMTNKLVLELHNYENGATSCSGLQSSMQTKGYQAHHPEVSSTKHVMPVLMTEFGLAQDETEWKKVYATCIADLLTKERSGWFIWVVVGSYYSRQGTQDFDEAWGLLNHDWSDWRSPSYINGGLGPLIKATSSG